MQNCASVRALVFGVALLGFMPFAGASPQEPGGGPSSHREIQVDSQRPTSAELSKDPYMLRSRFTLVTGTRGSASLYPTTPTDVYSKNIEAANKRSDPEAMYWVARSLELCIRVGDEDEIETIKSSNIYDEEFIQRIEIDLTSCKGILNSLGAEVVNDRQTAIKWYLKAYDVGSELAKAWHVSFAPSEYTVEEAVSAVLAAYRTDKSALRYLQSYFAYQGDELLAWAWALAECEVDARCAEEILDAQLESDFYQYQYETIKDNANEYRASIATELGGSK